MIAETGARLIAKFIDKKYPQDRNEIYEILKLACNRAWQEGRFHGMTMEGYVPIQKDSNGYFIITPKSHPILLAANTEFQQGITLRDKNFIFHRNGDGSILNRKGCKWNKDIYDLGYVPIINESYIAFSKGVTVGVRAMGQPGPDEFVNINGSFSDGEKVFTYKSRKYGQPCNCSANKEEIETVNGVSIAVGTGFNYISNIKFSSIQSITKTNTRTPIEVIAIDYLGNGHLISKLDPNTRESKYRKYIAPDPICKRNCLHGLFKIAQQEDILSPTDRLIISNEEALINISKGIHQIYYKEQPDIGAGYILQGISLLEKEKREEDSPTDFPIQVDMTLMNDLPETLRYNS